MGLQAFGIGRNMPTPYREGQGKRCPHCKSIVSLVNSDWVLNEREGGCVVGFAPNDDPKHLPGVLFLRCRGCATIFYTYVSDLFLDSRRKAGDTRFWDPKHVWADGFHPSLETR